MAGIRGKDTRPEMVIRSALHRRGFRYRLHDKTLPGKPDLVFPRLGAVILIHGCFWHCHNCHLFKWPSSRTQFWQEKIEGNRARDRVSFAKLKERDWRILTIWECALKGRTRQNVADVVDTVANWLTAGTADMEIRGIVDAHNG